MTFTITEGDLERELLVARRDRWRTFYNRRDERLALSAARTGQQGTENVGTKK